MPANKLYYGDNLDVLRRYVRDESVDLVYLDPPFNSRQDYNVLFAEKDGIHGCSMQHTSGHRGHERKKRSTWLYRSTRLMTLRQTTRQKRRSSGHSV